MWESTPWFVRNGKHSPALARLLAYAATSGAEGIVEPEDCKVVPLAVPGLGVQVMPGGALIRNRAPGGGQQTYVGRNPEAEQFLGLTPTPSGGPRSDLIVARLRDPEFPGVAEPDNYDTYDFIRTEVVEGVPVSTRRLQDLPGRANDSAITLARVTRPASTATVEASHIVDLRNVANPRLLYTQRSYNLVKGQEEQLTSTAEEWFPNGGAQTGGAGGGSGEAIDIPEWATRMSIIATWASVQYPGGNAWGEAWVSYGPQTGTSTHKYSTQRIGWDSDGETSSRRINWICTDSVRVPDELRGTKQPFVFKGRVLGGSGNARPRMGAISGVSLQVQFLEAAV